MVNYSNGKIYKIECPTGDGDVYVGSTTKMYLSQRMDEHRNRYKGWKNGKEYKITSYSIFEKYGVGNCKIVLIETVNASSKDELSAREAHWIKELQCVNKVIPGRTEKEYNETRKEIIAQRNKEYYEEHKEVQAQRHKEYNETHKEIIAQCSKKHYEKNKEAIAQRHKEYTETHKEVIAQRSKEYYETHKEIIAQRQKEYRERNKEIIAQKKKEQRVAAAAARATAASL